MSFRTSLLRSTMNVGIRPLHTSRVLALQASKARSGAFTASADINPNDTGGYKYVPGGPVLPGTVNDAATFPESHKAHGSYHWAFERVLSAALIPIMGGAAVSSGSAYPILDGLLATSLIVHSHIGFDSCVVDYLHDRKFPSIGPAARWILRGATGLAVWGVYEFNTNDIGLTELVRRIWLA